MGLIIADLAAIEYRIVGWMSNCVAIWDVVKNNRDPYLDFAQKLYANKNYKYDDLKKRYESEDPEIVEVRQNSKPPVLGGGYGLGKGEIITNQFGDQVRSGLWGYALNVCGVDMPQSLAGEAVRIYRETNYEVVQFWADVENAFKWTLRKGEPIVVGEVMWNKFDRCWSPCSNNFTKCTIRFSRIKSKSNGYIVRIELPSGRPLHYLNAQVKKEEKFGRMGETIYYEGIEHSQTTDEDGTVAKKNFKWGLTKTYGGKLCLAGATQILTNRGIIPLTSVLDCDKLWDGKEWVNHSGLVYNGEKETKTWMGLTATPDHEILAGKEWHELQKAEAPLVGRISQLTGLASVLRLFYTRYLENMVEADWNAIAGQFSKLIQERCTEDKSIRACLVRVLKDKIKGIKDTLLYQIKKSGPNGYIAEQELFLDAIIRTLVHTPTMVEEELLSINRGETTQWNGSDMPLLLKIGINQIWTWIESTMTEIMNQETSGSCHEKKMQTIEEVLFSLNTIALNTHTCNFMRNLLLNGEKILYNGILTKEGPPKNALKDTGVQKVYDLLNAGPRHRFTIVTESGIPLVVHNCENICQAIARDVLVHGSHLARDAGFKIIGLFHDEMATEEGNEFLSPTLDDLVECMTTPPEWGKTLILGAEGFCSPFYRKG